MIEIRKPSSIDANDFYNIMAGINFNALKGIEGRNKGKADPHYIARWDETIISAPTDAEIITQLNIVNLVTVKKAKKNSIDTNYKTAEDVPITLGGFTFDADTKALTDAMSIVVAIQDGYVLPGSFSWIDSTGTARPTNASGIRALFRTISRKHYQDAHNYAKLTKQVKYATTIADVNAVSDW